MNIFIHFSQSFNDLNVQNSPKISCCTATLNSIKATWGKLDRLFFFFYKGSNLFYHGNTNNNKYLSLEAWLNSTHFCRKNTYFQEQKYEIWSFLIFVAKLALKTDSRKGI